MDELLDIGAVARATGLSLRALRFYEGRGLVRPLRTAGGRRVYGAGELARLHAAVALKRAGFSLARIADLLAGRTIDLKRLIVAQLAEVEAQAAAIAASRDLLGNVLSRIDRGEPIDVATLCSLIRNGDRQMEMEMEKWHGVTDRYFTPDQQQALKARMPVGFDGAAYGERWREFGARINAALPLDPASDAAQAFADEWFALLKPFSDVATPDIWASSQRMYADRPNWQIDLDPGFSHAAWQLIAAAVQARRAAGGTVDGPAWMAAPPRE